MGRRRARGRHVLVLACVLALLPVAAWGQPGELVPQLDGVTAERDRVEARVESLRQREGDARTQLAAVEAELSQAEADLARSKAELERAEAALAAAEGATERARAALEEVLADLADSEAELLVATAKLEARVIAAYKYGQISFTEAFTGVKDMADFISSSTMVAHVLDGDRVMVEEFTTLHHAVESQRAQAQALRVEAERELAAAATAAEEIEAATQARAAALATIEERRAEREELFLALRDDREAAEGHLAGLEAESARITDQLAAIARQQAEAEAAEEVRRQQEAAAAAARAEEEAARRAAAEQAGAEGTGDDSTGEGPASGGGGSEQAAPAPAPQQPPPPVAAPSGPWVRPAPGPLTSPFGPRWGRNHNGVDIGGGEGTAIVASRPGTVVTAISSCHPTSSWGCGGGFGNYVTVAHASGMATIYAHLASVSVGAGQQVEAGQVLGTMGNSGNSYGRHVHFEVREAGVPRNPCAYIAC